jgi:hypothetical protein
MARTEVTVGTEGFREYLEFILVCSMDYGESTSSSSSGS